MDRDPSTPPARPSRKIIWAIAGLLILVLVIIAVQGMVRGGGEAAGVTEAAPGDTNASPAPQR